METARVVVLIGGMLVLFGLFLGLAFVYSATAGDFGTVISNPLIVLGVFISLVCGLVLFFSENALFLLMAGILGTISSFLLVGGFIGGIGGILGIVGSVLMRGEDAEPSRQTFESASTPSSSLEQHSIRCPRCGYLNKADSIFCGKCRYPLNMEEK